KQTVYTYDANGNQITKTAEGKTETNTYDGLNQLIGFTDGETTASYKYNASGLRYEKTVDGQTINHVWDGNKQIVADVIDNQFYEADCYIRGTNLVAKYNYWNGKKTEYTYYTQNAHGDVVNLTDKDGKVTKSYRYDAFGVEKNIDENDTNAFRYCGEYFDKETATVYLRARNYNPSTGRFISRDSFAGVLSDPLSLNLYTYCGNNPIFYKDSSGHSYGTLPDGTKMSINSASDAKRFYQERDKQLTKAKESEVNEKKTDFSGQTISAYNPDTPSMINIGTAYDQSNNKYREIWLVENRFVNDFKDAFNSNEIYIIDVTTPDRIDYQIYNSYKYWDKNLIDDTVYWLKKYNDEKGRTQYDRSLTSLKHEWYEHNVLYYVFQNDEEWRESAKHANLDENGMGTYLNYWRMITE
ncbi:MAG: RHS repeat-associated core domain-containing protein, partial [Oscillospiraceae bacterium]